MLKIILLSALAIIAGLAAFTFWQSARIASAFSPEGKFVDIDGGRMHYTERLPDGAPRGTVLLIHGASGNQADMMVPLGERIARQGFRVLAFDRPGQGWSDRIARRDASPAVQADRLRRAAEKLGIEQAIVVAHSLAGVAATNLALDHKAFVAGLVLVAPVTHPWPGGIAAYYTLASTPVIDQIFARLLVMPIGINALAPGLAGVFAPNPAPPEYLDRTGVALVLRPEAFMANAQDVAALYDFVSGQSPRLSRIEAPTAIITGDTDSIVLTHIHSYGSHKAIAGATLNVLPGVGHSPHWVNPQAVVDAVKDVAERGASISAPSPQARTPHR
jgi:pimeloyl-ACP methyl ester carboxylesterase